MFDDLFTNGARLLWIEGGAHNDLFAAYGARFWPQLLGFARGG